jgi:hypothetical protein
MNGLTNIRSGSFAGMSVKVGVCLGRTYAKGLESNKGAGMWTLLTELPNGQHRAKLLSGQFVTSQLVIEEAEDGA